LVSVSISLSSPVSVSVSSSDADTLAEGDADGSGVGVGDAAGDADALTLGVDCTLASSAFAGESGTDVLARWALTRTGWNGASGPQPLSANPATAAATATTPTAATCQVRSRVPGVLPIMYLRVGIRLHS
jgi:hypothetical protein